MRIHLRMLTICGAALAVATVAASACNPSNPVPGNLELLNNGSVIYSALAGNLTGFALAIDQTELQYQGASNSSLELQNESVSIGDGFASVAAPLEVLIGVRDTQETQNSLQGCIDSAPNNTNCFGNNIVGPGGGLATGGTSISGGNGWENANSGINHAITLPGLYSLPYPAGSTTPFIPGEVISTGALTPDEFTGLGLGNWSLFGGNASAYVKNLYVFEHGSCSQMTSATTLVSKMLPTAREVAVTMGVSGDFTSLETSYYVSTWMAPVQDDIYGATGGLISELDVTGSYSGSKVPIEFGATARVSMNDTFTWGLNGGIVTLTSHENANDNHNDFKDLILKQLRSGYVDTVTSTVASQVFAAQAQAIPNAAGGTIPCSADGLANTNAADDLSWYQDSNCAAGAIVLEQAAAWGVQAYNLNLANFPNKDPAGMLKSETISNGMSYWDNIRCNPNPSYSDTPTCEVVARVWRLNVLPDVIESVVFDGAGLDRSSVQSNVNAYGVEGFQAYLAYIGGQTRGDPTLLNSAISAALSNVCTYQGARNQSDPSDNLSTPFTRPFIHGASQVSL